MTTDLVSVLGTLAGVAIGGVIVYLSNRSLKILEWHHAIARDRSATRQRLYAEFLTEVQKTVSQGREGRLATLSSYDALNAKFAELSLFANDDVLSKANSLKEYAICSQSTEPASIASQYPKLLQIFIVTARSELSNILTNNQ